MVGESLFTKILMSLSVAGGGMVGMYFVQKVYEPSTVKQILKKNGYKIISESDVRVTESEEREFSSLVDLLALMKDKDIEEWFKQFTGYVEIKPKPEADIKRQKAHLIARRCKFSLGIMDDDRQFAYAWEKSRLFCTTFLKDEYNRKEQRNKAANPK